jgi:hypothetical protein
VHNWKKIMAGIQNLFKAQAVYDTGKGAITDGSILWEIVTPEGERIGACTMESSARTLETALNLALTYRPEEADANRTMND